MTRDIDTGTTDVLASVNDGIGRVVLNRPDRRNALSEEMLDALGAVLADFADADDVRVVLLTGAGAAFSAGGDVKAFAANGGEGGASATLDPARIENQRRQQRATVGRIHTMGKPVIGVLPGAAAGAALGLALACDLRIGSERAVLVTAFAPVGLSGDYGTAWLLTRLVGPAQAAELLFLSTRVDAARCLELGLLNQVVPDEQLQDTATAMARRLADGPRQALRGMKQNLLTAHRAGLLEAMDLEVELHQACGITDDHRRAVEAFVAKRTPVFT